MNEGILQVTNLRTKEVLLDFRRGAAGQGVAEARDPSTVVGASFLEKVPPTPEAASFSEVLNFISEARDASYQFFGEHMLNTGEAGATNALVTAPGGRQSKEQRPDDHCMWSGDDVDDDEDDNADDGDRDQPHEPQ